MEAAAFPMTGWQLSSAIRAASRQEHDAAEKSPFITELLDGNLGRAAYAAYLLRLRTVYAALETAMRRHRHDPVLAAFYDPALERLSAIDADLQYWTDASPTPPDSPVAEAYWRRLDGMEDGVALLAHHYTRYLGDLSGGQIIRRTLDRVFHCGGAGLAFYEFSVKTKRYKDGYRARLDALSLPAEDVEALLSEVKFAFRLNQMLLDELGVEFCAGCVRDS